MPKAFDRILDWLGNDGKKIVKSCYQPPIIRAAGRWRRALRRTCFIGVTGSAGKTTTKDLLHCALAGRNRCRKSPDSDNQLYDIARMLLATGPGTRFCVQELGASAPGRMRPMVELLGPRVGLVTNIGTDHFTSFRTREAVAEEKRQLVACLPADGIAVLNADDDLAASMARDCRARVVTYGMHRDASFRGELVTMGWPDRLSMKIHHAGECALAETLLYGRHHAGNVLAAVAAACSLGVSLAEAALGVGRCEPLLGRMSVYSSARGVMFVRDDWKAPYWSLPLAFEFMSEARAPRKVIVLGTISDYRWNKSSGYRGVVERALEAADHVLLVGSRADTMARRSGFAADGRVTAIGHLRDAAAWLGDHVERGDLVLLKGSGADHLGRLALAMDREVGCWMDSCRSFAFCDHCRRIGDTASP